jgi:hypothetical protein
MEREQRWKGEGQDRDDFRCAVQKWGTVEGTFTPGRRYVYNWALKQAVATRELYSAWSEEAIDFVLGDGGVKII